MNMLVAQLFCFNSENVSKKYEFTVCIGSDVCFHLINGKG